MSSQTTILTKEMKIQIDNRIHLFDVYDRLNVWPNVCLYGYCIESHTSNIILHLSIN